MVIKVFKAKPFVIDGDTLVSWENEQPIYYRIRWIDTPETKRADDFVKTPYDESQWKWGELAKSYLIDYVKNSNCVIYVEKGLDIYGRTLIDLYRDRKAIVTNYQRLISAAGLSAAYLPFPQNINLSPRDEITIYCHIIRNQYTARIRKEGIWRDPNFIMPWEWRRLKR
ncbi:thermonuclease family protein [Laspinema sp. D1]|uniref:Thermonuclease family protein n=1 Tax=Laspinema palackyanum D2a TaxID=2953684 RepID=A0ABT2MJW1_9CYAN|nr:thermonuclease family protein [Laspinema sp. D2a]